MTPLIASKNLALHATRESDLTVVLALESADENRRFIMPYSRQRHLACMQKPDQLHLTIRQLDDDVIAGFVILAGIGGDNRAIEFRRIVIESKGAGLGRQSLRLVKQHCFEGRKCHRLWLDVFEDNARAIHLYKSEGFREEGTLRDCVYDGTRYRSLKIFSMLESEYKTFSPN